MRIELDFASNGYLYNPDKDLGALLSSALKLVVPLLQKRENGIVLYSRAPFKRVKVVSFTPHESVYDVAEQTYQVKESDTFRHLLGEVMRHYEWHDPSLAARQALQLSEYLRYASSLKHTFFFKHERARPVTTEPYEIPA